MHENRDRMANLQYTPLISGYDTTRYYLPWEASTENLEEIKFTQD